MQHREGAQRCARLFSMAKIIKNNDKTGNKRLKSYSIQEFSSVTKGESVFTLKPFNNEELSVQDQATEDDMLGKRRSHHSREYNPGNAPDIGARLRMSYGEEITQAQAETQPQHAQPRRSSLFSTYIDDESMADSPRSAAGATSEFIQDAIHNNYEGSQAPKNVEKPFAQADNAMDAHFQEMPLGKKTLSGEEVNVPKSQQEQLKENVALNAVEAERDGLKTALEAKEKELSDLSEKLRVIEESIPEKVEIAKTQGFEDGKKAHEAEVERKYQADKKDYLEMVQKSWNEALSEVKKFDDTIKTLDQQIPEIIIGYLRELIGTERKLNDAFVTNLIKSAINKLTDTQQLIFMINPEDADIVTETYPQYGVSIDPSIPKGSVKIHSKTGDVDLSIDSWINSLETQINEQFKSS